MVTVQLICAFVFACAKIRFSHDAAQLLISDWVCELPEVLGGRPVPGSWGGTGTQTGTMVDY